MKPAKSRSRHGVNALMARVKVRGLAAIDRRTHAARALLEWRSQVVADLGGEKAVSAQQAALIEMATRTRLYIDHADAFLLGQESGLVNRRKRSFIPLVHERQRLVDSLARILTQLGLERPLPPEPTFAETIQAAMRLKLEKEEANARDALAASALTPAQEGPSLDELVAQAIRLREEASDADAGNVVTPPARDDTIGMES
jgi:hypothetical protein